jgi:hypothetical protein
MLRPGPEIRHQRGRTEFGRLFADPWACVRPAGGDAVSFDRRSTTRSAGFYGLLVTP